MVEEASQSAEEACNHVDDDNVEHTMDKNNDFNEDATLDSDDGLINYKEKYRNLKRKLKCLLYVGWFFFWLFSRSWRNYRNHLSLFFYL